MTVKATGAGLRLRALLDRKVPRVLNGIEIHLMKVTKGAALLRVLNSMTNDATQHRPEHRRADPPCDFALGGATGRRAQ
ncbi:hypothetical protein AGRA3207_004246 [Actinomadura graeca]|uniref:Transposase n=1 Tax=Actinomadura graeca TaxID=2750812 RepID=A0ABX8QWN5_9ACTN|nr:hypothetical protein [Actinomadura graeca]QXJ23128.1 hypothetical protein AGRA3207_004246 [Actinomadura graeca]